MVQNPLKNLDPLDIDEMLLVIENSFKIKFEEEELLNITTFGQLCDCTVNKISLEYVEDCTTQQAFYKVRQALIKVTGEDKNAISPTSDLNSLFQKKCREEQVKEFKEILGVKIYLISASDWIIDYSIFILFISFILLRFGLKFGFLGILISILGLCISSWVVGELKLKTVGDIAEEITRQHYLSSRRNPETFNRKEVEKTIKNMFTHWLGIEEEVLTRNLEF